MSPLVSILIPVFNRQDYIEETILSAVGQTYENIEIVVVDNQSSDDTWAIVERCARSDSRIKPFRNASNVGPVRNWKECLNHSTGEYGKILWSDDLIAPTFVEKSLSMLRKNDDMGFVFTGTEIFGQKRRWDVYYFDDGGVHPSEVYITGILFDGAGSRFPVSPGCALFRIRDLKKNLLVDVPNTVGSDFSQHAIGNDLLLYLIAASDYPYFGFINEKLSYFREHDDAISISSKIDDLVLSYCMAKAFFVEQYRPDLLSKFNAGLYLDLLRYRHSSLALNSVKDFYRSDKSADYSYGHVLSVGLKRALLYAKDHLTNRSKH